MKNLAKSIEDGFLSSILGASGVQTNTVASIWGDQEPFTLDKLNRMIVDVRAKIGPTPVFLSSRLFPADGMIVVEGATEKFHCASDGFWMKVQHAERKAPPPPSFTGNPLFSGVQVVEIDYAESDTDERREYLDKIWTRLRKAFEVAMVELPEWLRQPARPTRFG